MSSGSITTPILFHLPVEKSVCISTHIAPRRIVVLCVSFSPTFPRLHRARSPRHNICQPGSWTWPAQEKKQRIRIMSACECTCARADDDVCVDILYIGETSASERQKDRRRKEERRPKRNTVSQCSRLVCKSNTLYNQTLRYAHTNARIYVKTENVPAAFRSVRKRGAQ